MVTRSPDQVSLRVSVIINTTSLSHALWNSIDWSVMSNGSLCPPGRLVGHQVGKASSFCRRAGGRGGAH